ncbi:MAG: hypothetical protein ACE5O2_17545 [Armatimonadota bacterium]
MLPKNPLVATLASLIVLVCLAGSAAAEAVATLDFEEAADLEAWNSTDPEAVLTIARDPANVRDGTGALQFSYFPREDAWFIVQTGQLAVAGARSLSFAVKTSEATPLLVGLGEADGSHYDAFIECPENEWVDVQLSVDDLLLRRGDDDENGRLDLDQVTQLSFMDCSNMPGEEGRALGWKRGQQYMWIDRVAFATDEAPSASEARELAKGIEIILGTHTADWINALAVGGAKLRLVRDGDQTALRAEYGAGAQRWAGFVTGIGQLDLRGLDTVRMNIRAPENVKVHVLLEERDGSKYESVLQIDGKPGWQTVQCPIADFRLDDTSADENEQLDLGQLRVIIVVVDTFTSMVGGGGTGSIDVGEIALLCQEVPPAEEKPGAEPAAAEEEEPAAAEEVKAEGAAPERENAEGAAGEAENQ